VTSLQIALASLDAFVIVAGASVVGNLLAGRIQRWWGEMRFRRLKRRLRANPIELPQPDWEAAFGHIGIVRSPAPGGRCAHLRERELCDECNEPKKGG